MTYALIGDIHSQGRLLALALDHCQLNGLTPILLGDLFDSRCDVDETVYTLNLARRAQREQGAIILNSNHQDRLIEALRGELEYGDYCYETFRSIAEFNESKVDMDELEEWLLSLPDGFVFHDSTGHEYCCAHAYFPVTLRKPEAKGAYTVRATSDEERFKMVWGPHNTNGRRFHWWKKLPTNQSFTRVCGHYHKVLIDDKALMLDANAGYEDGQVLLYDVEAKMPVYFS